ncbi:MAG: hypothetical protein ACI8PZ_002221 [Myxococcota bacterium]|jgi:hypothetical protein
MRTLVPILGLLLAPSAHAGGFGLLLNGGAHTEKVYYYSSHLYGQGEPVPFESPGDYEQYEMVQTLSNIGGGLELILGDRDDRVVGTFRFFYQQDGAQLNPADATTEIQKVHVVANVRETPRHVGIGMVGIDWGFVGDPSKFMFGATGHVGSGFLTTDHTEFLTWDIGPMVSYKLSRAVQMHADVVYQGRFRKGYSHGATGYLGIRYMFD